MENCTYPTFFADGLECKHWDKMSVTNTIFGRRELVVADIVYIRNGSASNIGVQTYNTYQ